MPKNIGEMVKNYNRMLYLSMLFVIMLGINHIPLVCGCTTEGRKKIESWINSKQTVQLYTTMDNYKIALFASDDLIQSGIPNEDSAPDKQWVSLIACSNDYIKKLYKSNPRDPILGKYNENIKDLEKIDLFLRSNIRDIHEKYLQNKLSKNYLEAVKKRVEFNSKKAREIFNFAYFNIVSKYPNQKEDLKIIFPNYEVLLKVFEDWKKLESENAKKTGTPFVLTHDAINAFLNYTQTLYIPKSEQNTPKALLQAKGLFDKFGKLVVKLQAQIYEQQQKVKKSWFFKSQEEEKLKKLMASNDTIIKNSKEIMHAILATYLSNKIPDEFFKKIYETQDVASLIIFAESGSLQDVLNSLLRVINRYIAQL